MKYGSHDVLEGRFFARTEDNKGRQ